MLSNQGFIFFFFVYPNWLVWKGITPPKTCSNTHGWMAIFPLVVELNLVNFRVFKIKDDDDDVYKFFTMGFKLFLTISPAPIQLFKSIHILVSGYGVFGYG